MASAGEVIYIVRAYLARRKFGVNWHIYMNVEDVTWNIIVKISGHWKYCWHMSPCIVTLYDTIVQM